MLKYKIFTVLLALKTFFCSCDKDMIHDYKDLSHKDISFKKKAKIDRTIDESSGLAWATDSTFYTHNDGTDNHLYEINLKGELLSTTEIRKASFIDFEEISEDSSHLYLGDIGNNSNLRKSLSIYKVNKKDFNEVDTIQFSYAEQTEFPPNKKHKNFDCEAFVCYRDSLFLFSKNRGYKLVKLYGIPAKKGIYKVKAIDSLYLTGQITAADISPDKTKLALLAYGKIYIFDLMHGLRLNNPYYCIKFPESGQVEGILFIDNSKMIITNEGGKIFSATIKK